MSKENWSRIEHLYHHASELNGKERRAYLDLELSEDESLRREVESLLANDEAARSFLETKAPSVPRASPEAPTADMTRPSLTAGAHLGPYEILSLIGSGGMGEVYRGRDTRLQRTVAIKILSANVVHDPERRQRFLQEARAASALSHPNIVTLHDIGSDSGVDYFVMEYVAETSLDQRISSKPMPLPEILECGIQIGKALAAAHAAGIIHRDIKPANIMVTRGQQVKVLDFGLAKWPFSVTDESPTKVTASLTQAGHILGTVAYMSPEQARGEPLDARTDLFSLGALLYEMATGRRAFPRKFDWTTPPSTGIDPSLRRVILKLIQPDRESRYASAAEVVADLMRLQSSQSRLHRYLWLAGAGAFGALLISAFFLLRPSPPPPPSEWSQVTNLPDPVSQPALSSDGRMLTFIRGPGTFYTPGQIYVKVLPDGEPKPLTHDALSKLGPVFSPDGSRIAYTTVDSAGFKWDTWTVPVLGGEPGLWMGNASGLTWIGVGKLMFSEIKKNLHMAIVSSDENRTTAKDVYIPARENGMAHRSFLSPDGKWALVVEMDGSWLPCRLVAIDRADPGRQVGPAGAPCTSAAWSPDGKWMYLNADAGGAFHIWRQRFPAGQSEQITSGLTQEEGIAVSPDGRSLITAVGLTQRAVILHDLGGERQLSLEGYASHPIITPDGKHVCYTILKGASAADPIELWTTDLDSGRHDLLLPGFSVDRVFAFDVSADGRQVAMAVRGPDAKIQLWVVAIDRKTPPRRIGTFEVDRSVHWLGDEIVFYSKEGDSGFAYRVRQDGTNLRKAIEQPISEIQGVSPDGNWLIAWAGGLTAYPMIKGSLIRIFGADLRLRWSSDRKLLFIQFSATAAGGVVTATGKTYIVPLPPGEMLPPIPDGGFRSLNEIESLPGVRVIESEDGTPGGTPDTYAFSRETTQRNLYRIPLR